MGNLRSLTIVAAAIALMLSEGKAIVVRATSAPYESRSPDPVHAPFMSHVGCFPRDKGTATSLVYLGNGRVLTAWHAFASRQSDTVWIDGNTYPFDRKKVRRLSNAADKTMRTDSDLVVIELSQAPDLPSLRVAKETPFIGERIVMIGFGQTRAGDEKFWDVNAGWAPTDSVQDNVAIGYETQALPGTYRGGPSWGENLIAATDLHVRAGKAGDLRAFCTYFNPDELSMEAQAAPGDSGGAVFVERGSRWELAGILQSTGAGLLSVKRIPSEMAVFGAASYVADLSFYRSQLTQPIPEPQIAALSLLSVLFLGTRRRR